MVDYYNHYLGSRMSGGFALEPCDALILYLKNGLEELFSIRKGRFPVRACLTEWKAFDSMNGRRRFVTMDGFMEGK